MDKEKIKNLLSPLGLSEKEILVYLTVLEIPEALPSTIARKTKIKRSTTYAILDELQSQGLIRRIKRKGFTRIQASSPNSFLQTKKDEFQEKVESISKLEKELKTLLFKQKGSSFRSIIPNLTLEEASQSIVNEMMTNITPIGGAFFIAEKETGLLRGLEISDSTTGRFATKAIGKKFSSILIPYKNPINLTGRCAAEKSFFISTKVEDFACPTISKALAKKIQDFGRIKTLIALPIISEQETLGVLLLSFKETRKKVKAELERMKLFRDQATLAINNAKKQKEFQLRYQTLTAKTSSSC